jgi:hypothetical protein
LIDQPAPDVRACRAAFGTHKQWQNGLLHRLDPEAKATFLVLNQWGQADDQRQRSAARRARVHFQAWPAFQAADRGEPVEQPTPAPIWGGSPSFREPGYNPGPDALPDTFYFPEDLP